MRDIIPSQEAALTAHIVYCRALLIRVGVPPADLYCSRFTRLSDSKRTKHVMYANRSLRGRRGQVMQYDDAPGLCLAALDRRLHP